MYNIRFSKRAGKYIRKLDTKTKKRIKQALLLLAENPCEINLNVRKLAGYKNSYRLRVGKYRILYKVMQSELVIFVFDTDSRGDIYKL